MYQRQTGHLTCTAVRMQTSTKYAERVRFAAVQACLITMRIHYSTVKAVPLYASTTRSPGARTWQSICDQPVGHRVQQRHDICGRHGCWSAAALSLPSDCSCCYCCCWCSCCVTDRGHNSRANRRQASQPQESSRSWVLRACIKHRHLAELQVIPWMTLAP
jgi:hypothetical protein